MTAMRRTAWIVTAVVVLSGLVGAASGCAGPGSSGASTAGGGGGGVTSKGAVLGPLTEHRSAAVAGSAVALAPSRTRDVSLTRSLPPIRSAVIKTATLDLRVAHARFGDAMDRLAQIATDMGGFVSRRTQSGTSVHDGVIVIRVPVARFSKALPAVERVGRPTNEAVVGQDVTEQFVNLDARLVNLESQQRALRKLMGRAVTISDTIRVQNVLQGVELQLEELQGQLIYLRNRTAMSTITVAVHEAGARPTPPAHASALWKAGARSLHAALAIVTSVIVGAGVVIPVAILVLLAVLIGRLAAPWAAPLVARRRGTAGAPPDA